MREGEGEEVIDTVASGRSWKVSVGAPEEEGCHKNTTPSDPLTH